MITSITPQSLTLHIPHYKQVLSIVGKYRPSVFNSIDLICAYDLIVSQ